MSTRRSRKPAAFGWLIDLETLHQSIIRRHNLQPPDSNDDEFLNRCVAGELFMLQNEHWTRGVPIDYRVVHDGQRIAGCMAIACTDRNERDLPRAPPSPELYPKWTAWLKETGQELTPR